MQCHSPTDTVDLIAIWILPVTSKSWRNTTSVMGYTKQQLFLQKPQPSKWQFFVFLKEFRSLRIANANSCFGHDFLISSVTNELLHFPLILKPQSLLRHEESINFGAFMKFMAVIFKWREHKFLCMYEIYARDFKVKRAWIFCACMKFMPVIFKWREHKFFVHVWNLCPWFSSEESINFSSCMKFMPVIFKWREHKFLRMYEIYGHDCQVERKKWNSLPPQCLYVCWVFRSCVC